MDEVIFNEKELMEMTEVEPLEDMLDIEKVALLIKKMNEKVDFFNDLKKKRTEDVNKEIAKVDNKIDFYKQVILATTANMDGKRHLTFPGVCSVTDKKTPDKFTIDDMDKFVEYLKKEDKVEEFIRTKEETVVDKSAVNKLCKKMTKGGNLPDGIIKEKEKRQLSIVFETKKQEVDLSNIDATKDIKTDDVGDELDF